MKIVFVCVNLWFEFLKEKIEKHMCLARNWKQLSSFTLTLLVGISAGLAFQPNGPQKEKIDLMDNVVVAGEGRGRSSCHAHESRPSQPAWEPRADGLKILAKPRAVYTDAARVRFTQGKVALRVTFLANGEIGAVVPVTELPHGLTEQAIAAARGIRFEPARQNGQPVTVTKTVEYNFTIF